MKIINWTPRTERSWVLKLRTDLRQAIHLIEILDDKRGLVYECLESLKESVKDVEDFLNEQKQNSNTENLK